MKSKERKDSMEYVDVRGPHPVYHKGMVAIRLIDQSRGITIEQARELIKTERLES